MTIAQRILFSIYGGLVVGLIAFASIPYPQAAKAATGEDAAVGIARLEARVDALDRLIEEHAEQVKTALEAADKVTSKTFPSREDFSSLSDRVGALETGAAGGSGRLGGVDSARDLTLTAIPIGLSVLSLLIVIFLAFGRRATPRSPSGG